MKMIAQSDGKNYLRSFSVGLAAEKDCAIVLDFQAVLPNLRFHDEVRPTDWVWDIDYNPRFRNRCRILDQNRLCVQEESLCFLECNNQCQMAVN